MRLYIPSKNESIKPNHRSWFSKTLADAVRSKKKALIEWKSNATPENDLLRKQARNRCISLKNAETSSIPYLIKDDRNFTHTVEKANISADIFFHKFFTF